MRMENDCIMLSLSGFENRCVVTVGPMLPPARAKVHSIIHVETSKKMHPSWVVMFMPNHLRTLSTLNFISVCLYQPHSVCTLHGCVQLDLVSISLSFPE